MSSRFTRVETTNWQNVMLTECADLEDGNAFQDRMLARWAVLVEPSLDARRVNRAFQKVCDRYDALRMSFHIQNGRNEARVHAEHPTGVMIQDIGDVSDDAFQTMVEDAAAKPMSSLAFPVFEMIVMKFGARGDVLLVRIHQIICDGYSIVLLIEDFLKYMINIPIPFPAMTHAQFIQKWERPDKAITPEEDRFWKNRLLPVPKSPNLGLSGQRSHALMPSDIKRVSRLDVSLPKTSLTKVQKAAQSKGVTFYTCAFSAFGEAICDLGHAPSTYISSVVGRNDKRLNTYFGHFARLLVSIYEAQTGKSPDDRLDYTSKMIMEGMKKIEIKGVRLENQLGMDLMDAGLRPFQFAVHTHMAYGRMKSSVFSRGFMTERGSTISLGSYTLREVKITPPAEALAELQLNIEENENGHKLSLAADKDAYSEKDLKTISRAVKSKLMEGL